MDNKTISNLVYHHINSGFALSRYSSQGTVTNACPIFAVDLLSWGVIEWWSSSARIVVPNVSHIARLVIFKKLLSLYYSPSKMVICKSATWHGAL